MSLLLLLGSAVAPVDVTGIDLCVHGSACTITGTGFGASQGTITLDGASQTITAWSDTSATFTVDRGNSRYGGVTVTLFNADMSSSDSASAPGATLAPPAGWDYVGLLDPLASTGIRLTAVADLAGGDQVAYGNVQGSGSVVTGEAGVTLNSDATHASDSWVTAFDAEAHDGVTWGAVATQTIGAAAASADSGLSRPVFGTRNGRRVLLKRVRPAA